MERGELNIKINLMNLSQDSKMAKYLVDQGDLEGAKDYIQKVVDRIDASVIEHQLILQREKLDDRDDDPNNN